MEEWFRISLLLCTFGYLKQFRPSEPFIVDYLTGPSQNCTTEEVYQNLFPIGTYSYLAQIVLIFLITDFFRYKPFIILCGFAGVASWSLLAWSTSWTGLILAHVFYGTFMATEIAYYTYIYAKVDKEKYQRVTSYTRAAVLAGNFCASVLGQILIFTEVMDSKQLNYITVGSHVMASIWAFLLPTVPTSLYFHHITKYSTFPIRRSSVTSNISNLETIPSTQNIDKVTLEKKISDGMKLLWGHFLSAYRQKEVLHWSLWYSLAMGGFGQVTAYIQVLWQDIEPDLEQTAILNGAIDATLTILGATAAILAGRIKVRALHFGLLSLTLCSVLGGGAIILAAITSTLWIAYIGYVFFGVLYHFMITYSSYEIAKHLSDDSFGLIFGINSMMALVFQSTLTVVVISESGFNLLPRNQFTVYGSYFVVLGALYFIAAIVAYFRRSNENEL